MMEYNGHRNYSYWNVAHWLETDEALRNKAHDAIRSLVDKDKAARYLLDTLPHETPDSVLFTYRNIRAALKKINV